MGHISFVYLDDGFGSQPDKCSAAGAAIIQKKELDSSGLLVNEEKCHWFPMQIGEWLGFVINSIAMIFQIPETSNIGFGGVLASLDGVMASGMFTSEDFGQRSTFRESKAIYSFSIIVLCGAAEAQEGKGFYRQSERS